MPHHSQPGDSTTENAFGHKEVTMIRAIGIAFLARLTRGSRRAPALPSAIPPSCAAKRPSCGQRRKRGRRKVGDMQINQKIKLTSRKKGFNGREYQIDISYYFAFLIGASYYEPCIDRDRNRVFVLERCRSRTTTHLSDCP